MPRSSWAVRGIVAFSCWAILAFAGSSPAFSEGEEPAAAATPSLEPAIGKEVEIEPKTGRALTGKVLEVTLHPQTKQPFGVRVELAKGQKRLLKLADLKKITLDGQSVYEAPTAEELKEAAKKRPLTKEQIAARAAKLAEEEQKWRARLAMRGIKPWPILTEAEHLETMREHQQMVAVVNGLHPGMALYETPHFVVYTDIAKDSVKPHVDKLEELYKTMCSMYDVPGDTQVFRGKALILAFEKQEDFKKAEIALFQNDPVWAYGICHSFSDGKVVVACYHGDEAGSFDHMLVHETSHGFVHRYQTAVRLPSWVNEGMADFVADRVVPEVAGRKQKGAIERLKQTKSVGAEFFSRSAHIEPWQYGVAVDLNGFLVKRNKERYVDFIHAMKEGLDWVEALQITFSLTPATLLTEYGKSIGVPDLKQ
ncbi:MAG TPA: hypothetical protein VGE52_17650 [Pirellulales bacterium]